MEIIKCPITGQLERLDRETGEWLPYDDGLEKGTKPYFLGPRGGKYEDSALTKPYQEDKPEKVKKKKDEYEPPTERYSDEEAVRKLTRFGDRLHEHQRRDRSINDIGLNNADMPYWYNTSGDLWAMRRMLKKYHRQIDRDEYYKLGLADPIPVSLMAPRYLPNGTLVLPVDGYLKGNLFDDFKAINRNHGVTFNFQSRQNEVRSNKLDEFDFEEYRKDMGTLGIMVKDPIGERVKPKPKEPLKDSKVFEQNEDLNLASMTTQDIIRGIKSYDVEKTIVFYHDKKDGMFKVYSNYHDKIKELFSNVGGKLSMITEWDGNDKARLTNSLELAEEALEKLRVRCPDWAIVTDGLKEARIQRDQELADLQKPIPEVQEKIDSKFKLFDYQNECVRFLDQTDGNALIGDEMGLGKQQPLDAKLLTPTGWIRMGDVKVGDKLVDPTTGGECTVTGVFPQGVHDEYILCTKDGGETSCGIDHLWKVLIPNKNEILNTVIPTRDLITYLDNGRLIMLPRIAPSIFTSIPGLTLDRVISRAIITGKQVEMQCISVNSVEHTYITDDYIPTHNTLQTLAWAAKNNKKVLVVCPKVVRRTWVQEAHKFFPDHFRGQELVAADLRKKNKKIDLSNSNIVTVNYESLGKFEDKIKEAGFDAIIVDECLPGNAQVITNRGVLPIGEIVENRLPVSVLSCDLSSNELQWKPITRWLKHKRKQELVNVKTETGELCCTPTHKVWTEEEGFLEARLLRNTHHLRNLREAMVGKKIKHATKVLQQGVSGTRHFEGSKQTACGEMLRLVRGEVQFSVAWNEEKLQEGILREVVRGQLADWPTRNSRENIYQGTRRKIAASQFGAKEAERSKAFKKVKSRSRIQKKNQRGDKGTFSAKSGVSFDTWGKWLRTQTPTNISRGNGITHGGGYKNAGGTRPIFRTSPSMLQSGFRGRKNKIGDRGRWCKPFSQRSENSGRTQNYGFKSVRVESVTIQKRGSVISATKSFEQDKFIYDLEVSGNHNYIANGILVSNSHRMKNPKAKQTQTIFKVGKDLKHKILLSGTAVKNKREDLRTQLEMVTSKQEASRILTGYHGQVWHKMAAVYLARVKQHVLKDLPEKTTTIMEQEVPGLPDFEGTIQIGDISRLKDQVAQGKVPATKEVVNEILKSSEDRVIVFTESVAAAKKLAAEFGKDALLHYGTMSDNAREAVKEEWQKTDEFGEFITTKKVFVTTKQSMAVGATMTAANRVVFNDLPWTAADLRQAEDRAHRIGQKKAVNVYWVTAIGNDFDQNVTEIIKRKYELSAKINSGRQLTPAEREWMNKPLSATELFNQIRGIPAEPSKLESTEDLAVRESEPVEVPPNVHNPEVPAPPPIPPKPTKVKREPVKRVTKVKPVEPVETKREPVKPATNKPTTGPQMDLFGAPKPKADETDWGALAKLKQGPIVNVSMLPADLRLHLTETRGDVPRNWSAALVPGIPYKVTHKGKPVIITASKGPQGKPTYRLWSKGKYVEAPASAVDKGWDLDKDQNLALLHRRATEKTQKSFVIWGDHAVPRMRQSLTAKIR